MAVTHTTTVRNGIADYVVDLVDAGAGAGLLVIRATGTAASPGTEVATLTFADPAFGAASSGTASLASAMTDATSATGGTASTATIEDDSTNVCAHCSVTATGGGGDIELTTVTIPVGGTVSISSLSYTAPN